MLRKLAAGTSAAVVAAGLAAAPAVASRLPTTSDECGEAPSEQSGLDGLAGSFVFGPFADVPHLLAGDRLCLTVAPLPGASTASRGHGAAPPPVGQPVPGAPGSPAPGQPGGPPSDTPSVPTIPGAPTVPGTPSVPSAPGGPGDSGGPPPGDSGPGGPGRGDYGSPPSGSGDTSPQGIPDVPASTEFTPLSSPPGSTPTSSPAEFVGPAETASTPAKEREESPPLLPLTARETRPLTVAGGANLIAAGLAFIFGARRRHKRRGEGSA